MSYIVTVENRYIGSHTCEREHYGDQSVVRDGCILEAFYLNETANRCAMTSAHPSAELLRCAVDHLTDAERSILKSMTPDPWFPGNAGVDIFGQWRKWTA